MFGRVPIVRNERGIVLVVAIFMILATSLLVGTLMLTTVGERAIASNYHVAKGSLYSADAGVRTGQQVLANMARFKLDSLAGGWSPLSGLPIIPEPTLLFPAGELLNSSTNPWFNTSTTVSFADSDLTDSAQVFNYLYTVVSTGRQGLLGSRRVQSQGLLRVSASRGTFADYLIFTHVHLSPSGGAIWFTSSGSFDGRVHTNGEFRFAYQPTFQDLVSSVNSRAWFYNGGGPQELTDDHNGTIDVPHFFGGFQRGVPAIPLPANSFNQQNACLGLPLTGLAPPNTLINTQLGLPIVSTAPPPGIYIPNTGGVVTGGIYIQGNLSQGLMKLDGSGNQVYDLTQGATRRVVTIDRSANITSVYDGSTTTMYPGVPVGVMYCNGYISDLRGPDRVSGTPPPAVRNGEGMLVAATGDIVLQRDITYQDYNDGQSVLGIYSSGGNVRVGIGAPSNMALDAYVMATGLNGVFTVDNYNSGSPRGTLHLRGGMVSTYYGAFYTFNTDGDLLTGFGRDFHYDRRGLTPPYFPRTNRFLADQPSARTLIWKEI